MRTVVGASINGFGGKLEPGETSIACAARELEVRG